MARYPTFPTRFINTSDEQLKELYTTLETWSCLLTNESETRDIDVDAAPATNIYTVVTVTSIGRPRKGDIAYSTILPTPKSCASVCVHNCTSFKERFLTWVGTFSVLTTTKVLGAS